MTLLYSLTAEVLTTRSLLNNDVRTAITTNEYDYNLLSLMSEMVHNLNLKICIEGIETEEERVRILEIAPDYSQGFYFGRPCPYNQFAENFVLPKQNHN